MPTIFTKGDLFETDGITAFANGVSCAAHMDAGVAVAFKKKWPRMFEDYAARCADGRFHLGDALSFVDGDATIYSLAIQEHWKKKAKLPALARALDRMVTLAKASGVARIGLPRIGTGLGGLDWTRVKRVLTEAGDKTDVTLVVFDQFVRKSAPAAAADS
jgi:O-acetyl-ADP-ribose deacetylase (regulator of RNase III)